MDTCVTLRRVSALVVVVVLAGAPLWAHASEEEAGAVRPVPPRAVLTLDGQPLSQVMTRALGAILARWREQAQLGDAGMLRALATQPARQAATASSDPLWNGIAIGAGIGALFFFASTPVVCGSEDDCPFFSNASPLPGFVVIGAGIGALVDSLR